jgi:catechol-2,3-dioxygenase
MSAPAKLAHFVLRTSDIEGLAAWYCTVLEAKVVHRNKTIAFATFDEEHHRIAFLDRGFDKNPDPESNGVDHVAFTYESLGDLLSTYVRLRDVGIVPERTINHGMTTSMYYKDPDGNRIELQIENFDDPQAGLEFMNGPIFEQNPIGVLFDADELVDRFEAGEPVSDLVRQGDS